MKLIKKPKQSILNILIVCALIPALQACVGDAGDNSRKISNLNAASSTTFQSAKINASMPKPTTYVTGSVLKVAKFVIKKIIKATIKDNIKRKTQTISSGDTLLANLKQAIFASSIQWEMSQDTLTSLSEDEQVSVIAEELVDKFINIVDDNNADVKQLYEVSNMLAIALNVNNAPVEDLAAAVTNFSVEFRESLGSYLLPGVELSAINHLFVQLYYYPLIASGASMDKLESFIKDVEEKEFCSFSLYDSGITGGADDCKDKLDNLISYTSGSKQWEDTSWVIDVFDVVADTVLFSPISSNPDANVREVYEYAEDRRISSIYNEVYADTYSKSSPLSCVVNHKPKSLSLAKKGSFGKPYNFKNIQPISGDECEFNGIPTYTGVGAVQDFNDATITYRDGSIYQGAVRAVGTGNGVELMPHGEGEWRNSDADSSLVNVITGRWESGIYQIPQDIQRGAEQMNTLELDNNANGIVEENELTNEIVSNQSEYGRFDIQNDSSKKIFYYGKLRNGKPDTTQKGILVFVNKQGPNRRIVSHVYRGLVNESGSINTRDGLATTYYYTPVAINNGYEYTELFIYRGAVRLSEDEWHVKPLNRSPGIYLGYDITSANSRPHINCVIYGFNNHFIESSSESAMFSHADEISILQTYDESENLIMSYNGQLRASKSRELIYYNQITPRFNQGGDLGVDYYYASGRHRVVYQNLDVYEGEWRDGLRHGQGILYDANGNMRYEGEWQHGRRHGKGTSYHENGNMEYEGTWENGQPHGQGTSYDENGNMRYKGGWKNGEPHGKGITYYENGNMEYEGVWDNGRPHGQGIWFCRKVKINLNN